MYLVPKRSWVLDIRYRAVSIRESKMGDITVLVK